MEFEFRHEPCDCDETFCRKDVKIPSFCVNRLRGVVEPAGCKTCNGTTLHHNGQCLRCTRTTDFSPESEPEPQRISGPREDPEPAPSASVLSLGVMFSGKLIEVTDRKAIAKIVKILLEAIA